MLQSRNGTIVEHRGQPRSLVMNSRDTVHYAFLALLLVPLWSAIAQAVRSIADLHLFQTSANAVGRRRCEAHHPDAGALSTCRSAIQATSQFCIATLKRTRRSLAISNFSSRTALGARCSIPCYARLKLLLSTMVTCARRARAWPFTVSSTGAATKSSNFCHRATNVCNVCA